MHSTLTLGHARESLKKKKKTFGHVWPALPITSGPKEAHGPLPMRYFFDRAALDYRYGPFFFVFFFFSRK